MNEIMVTKNYGISTLDTAIQNGADTLLKVGTSTKDFALAMGALKQEHDKHDCVKTLKFPVWVDSMYSGACSGQTAYKYAQIALAFSADPALWDVLTLSKLSILLNTRTPENKDAISSAWHFFAWYGDSINRMQIARHDAWETENEKALSKIEEFDCVGDTDSANLWRERLKEEPKNGIVVPDDGLTNIEYFEMCADHAIEYLRKVPDSVLSDVVKAYRKPNEYALGEDGKAKKTVSTESSNAESGKPESGKEESAKTPDELKADAYSALLAYVSTLGDKAPKSLKTALMVLDGKSEK